MTSRSWLVEATASYAVIISHLETETYLHRWIYLQKVCKPKAVLIGEQCANATECGQQQYNFENLKYVFFGLFLRRGYVNLHENLNSKGPI